MNNSDMPAAPISEEETDRALDGVKIFTGLTKREHFAAMAMQAMLSNPKEWMVMGADVAMSAIEAADALLKALETKEEGQ